MNIRPYVPGKRAIKTSIAVMLCIAYGVALNHTPVIASIAAIICLKPTSAEGLRAMYMRMLGSAIGCALGLAAAELGYVIPGYEQFWCIFIVPVFLLLSIYVCNMLGAPDTIALSCAVLLIIATTFDLGAMGSFIYAGERLMDTAVGALFALLVNFLLWNTGRKPASAQPPPQTAQQLENEDVGGAGGEADK